MATNNNNKAVLDTSALMALFMDTEGAKTLYKMLPQLMISTVNLCEVTSEAAKAQISPAKLFELLQALDLEIVSFDLLQAQIVTQLSFEYREIKLFSELACLSLASRFNGTIYTANSEFAKLILPITIHQI